MFSVAAVAVLVALALAITRAIKGPTMFDEIASWALILLGSFFTVVGAFGLVRMPEVYTRMHAASVTDTLGVDFLILGMCLQAGLSLVTLKLLFLLALFFFT